LRQLLLVPLLSLGRLDGDMLEAGCVWRIDGDSVLDATGGIDLLAAYPGAPVGDAVRAES
jgi:hypothetical protein